MILDKETMFSDGESALTTDGADAVSDNVYDAGAAINLGSGEALKLLIHLSAKAGTTPTFQAKFVGADNAALSTNPITIFDTGTLADPVTVPQIVRAAIKSHTKKRFFGMKYTVAGTGGDFTVSAGLVKDEQTSPMV